MKIPPKIKSLIEGNPKYFLKSPNTIRILLAVQEKSLTISELHQLIAPKNDYKTIYRLIMSLNKKGFVKLVKDKSKQGRPVKVRWRGENVK
jgi:hypothetical protein